MSWTMRLSADKDIRQEDIDSIAPELLQLSPVWPNSKQPWGWSCAVDIYNPEGRSLTLHGAGFSWHVAEGFAKTLASDLKERGYKIRIGEMQD